MNDYRLINWRNQKTITDKVFVLCVVSLLWGADKLGLTYNQINIILFVIIWPILTLLLIAYSLHCYINHN